ncbi:MULTISPECIES: PP2C family protein-serine/threonine phosphatase [unclassified Crossiella]|uniref:PP2C family protein-serine/threonine phosphatase n=1 Tax=unclassified Crossiella TaxID=2620835 RepID=UPI001FFF5C41|nr:MULTISPECIES: PP2C family protein-serine/threonine phosphatase [unclassified Crossiella]MCK2245060.1 serine/threonine-protein phosphatase [Crossiella sp. S99.2]MCK2258641.1 serine/threonine-protein phosphatase [Crossiella sp. S99.1]
MRANRLAFAERAMLRAPAHDLGEVLADILHTEYGASGTEVFLADYRMLALQPLRAEAPAPMAIAGTPAGLAFGGQEPVRRTEDTHEVLYLPMTVRGDRFGVLRVSFSSQPAEEDAEELVDLAHAAAQAFRVAETATDRFRHARRAERLTLAAEIQWQLLPGRGLERAEFTLAGQLEPAYAVRGDNFDWTADADSVTVAVTNGMGESVDAALLTSLAINALRNARRAGVSLPDQAALADQAIWSQHGGRQHVSTLLLRLDIADGRVTAIDAGSPRIWRLRAGEVAPVHLEPQLPLGMFDSTVYVEQEFNIRPGDRLFLLSDGIYESVFNGRRYADSLERLLKTTANLHPGEAIRALLHDLRAFCQDQYLDDDAVGVCLDWVGRP